MKKKEKAKKKENEKKKKYLKKNQGKKLSLNYFCKIINNAYFKIILIFKF